MRSDYADIRARNESAWLMPNDGTRTNHRLRPTCAATTTTTRSTWSSSARAPAAAMLDPAPGPRRWRVVGLDAGPFWDPDADWVSDEARLAPPLLDRTAA